MQLLRPTLYMQAQTCMTARAPGDVSAHGLRKTALADALSPGRLPPVKKKKKKMKHWWGAEFLGCDIADVQVVQILSSTCINPAWEEQKHGEAYILGHQERRAKKEKDR